MNDNLPSSMIEMFLANARDEPDRVVLNYKLEEEWQELGWGVIARDASRYAVVLREKGVQAGDRVILVSENRYEWILVDLAIQLLGAIHVPVHAPLTGHQIAYQVNDSAAVMAIVSGHAQASKLDNVELSDQLVLMSFDTVSTDRTYGDLPGTAADVPDEVGDAIMQERVDNPLETTSVATILYTSGTTGEPKGVMLSHHNLVCNTLSSMENFDASGDDIHLNFLPLSHIFARTCDYYAWIATSNRLVLAQSRDTIIEDCHAMKPTQMNGVPYFFDKLHRVLKEQGREDEPGSLRDLLGGNMVRCNSGGAALAEHVYDFFTGQGLHLLQGYGLTETSPVISMSNEQNSRRGASGRPLSGVEVAITEEGEIITRGPHVMIGYYKNEEATAEAIRDDWFYTGDLGHLDEDNFVYITGRKKELIVTAGGKNIAPVLLESLMTEDLLMEQAVVIGSERKFLTALVVVAREPLEKYLQEQQVELSWPDALEDPRVEQLLRERIDRQLENLSPYEQVGKFALLAEPFSLEREEMTAKLSLRRDVIMKNQAAVIEAMYEG
jgi:long-chain acyl-CoA synthetase